MGGTYPVTYALSGCATDGAHWDFQFKITAATQNGTDCNCPYLRVTLFDNPKRSRLWITTNGVTPNPSTNTNNSPRLYVTKVLAAGGSATFPAQGDIVRRVVNSPYTDFSTGISGTAGSTVGTIEGFGDSNDTLHVLMNPNGSLPCSASGPMAYYRVECGTSPNGPWTQLGDLGQINPCIPMIQSTVCRFNATGNGRYRLGISVLNACGLPASAFKITSIYRNNDGNVPNGGGSVVWSGNTALSGGVTSIDMTTAGSGGQLWITFTTDGVNFSRIRVPTNNTTCPVALTGEQTVEQSDEVLAPSGEESAAATGGKQAAPSGASTASGPSSSESALPAGGNASPSPSVSESAAPSGGESPTPSPGATPTG